MTQIKLVSKDGQSFSVDTAVAKKSETIKTMLEDLGLEEGGDDEPVPLPNVSGPILEMVIRWAEHHVNDPPAADPEEEQRETQKEVPEWDRKFFDVDQSTVFQLILAANYMDIKVMLDLGCKTVANMIKGKTPEEIRKTFNIKNDFAEGEEDNVREEK